jgi:hypothetical protein
MLVKLTTANFIHARSAVLEFLRVGRYARRSQLGQSRNYFFLTRQKFEGQLKEFCPTKQKGNDMLAPNC